MDKNYADLNQKVKSVMPIADELRSKKMIQAEIYAEIIAEKTNPAKMRKLFDSLNTDQAKTAFYYLLEKHENLLFKDLGKRTWPFMNEIYEHHSYRCNLCLLLTGGVSRKRKLSDPECSVPCKSEFNRQSLFEKLI